MPVYDGPPLGDDPSFVVRSPDASFAVALNQADLSADQRSWFRRAQQESRIIFFTIAQGRRPVGQIFLHDIDRESRAALIGYHVFSALDRRRGAGTVALRAVCDYALGQRRFDRLVAITGTENIASQRLATKCGFVNIGPAREGEHLVVFERTLTTQAPGGTA